MCIKHCHQLEYCVPFQFASFLQVFQVCASPPREATNITQKCVSFFLAHLKTNTFEMGLVAVDHWRDEEQVCQTS